MKQQQQYTKQTTNTLQQKIQQNKQSKKSIKTWGLYFNSDVTAASTLPVTKEQT